MVVGSALETAASWPHRAKEHTSRPSLRGSGVRSPQGQVRPRDQVRNDQRRCWGVCYLKNAKGYTYYDLALFAGLGDEQ